MSYRRYQPDSGFAIGAILFVIALMAIIATVIAACWWIKAPSSPATPP